ncbi:histidine kinase [Knoellia locipacati]|uniref:sensor histidine kinase n=1 Tax=Knoellia locipacati TaxID=882824 RepID=UPI003850B533
MQRGVGWGRVAHVFLAVAVALPVAVAAGAVVVSMFAPGQTPLNRGLLAVIAVVFGAIVLWVAHLPEVRPVEVSAARTLLGLDLPAVAAPHDWGSRRRGAVWLLVLLVVGLVVGVGLLYLLPVGVGLIAHPFTGADELARPLGGAAFRTGSGWDAAWLVVPGVLALAAVGGLVWAAGALLERLAPRVIGPTIVERVAVAAERERALARANALARDLHDSLGHRLTAMTLQASAARRLLRTDPGAAERAMAAVEDLGRRAQADVDAAVGALRGRRSQQEGGATPAATSDVVVQLRRILEQHPAELHFRAPSSLVLPTTVADTICRVAREALTNTSRHGTGLVDVNLESRSGTAVLEVRNAVAGDSDESVASERSGLQGLRERVLLDGGSLSAGIEEEGTWLLRATLPTR